MDVDRFGAAFVEEHLYGLPCIPASTIFVEREDAVHLEAARVPGAAGRRRQGTIDANLMLPLLIYAFAAVTLGGFDSIGGALVGGVVVAVVETMAGGEGPWIRGVRPCSPGVLVAGTNCVTTDAVATAVMGFDPMADRGKAPFETCDNTLRLAEELGVGTRDLKQIEVIGTPIQEAMFKFRDVPRLPVPGAGRRPS